MSKQATQNENKVQVYKQLDEEFGGIGGASPHTYEAHGGGELKLTTSNSMLDQKQDITKTIKVTDDGNYKVKVYNYDLEKTMEEKIIKSYDMLKSWDIKPNRDYIEPEETYTIEEQFLSIDEVPEEARKKMREDRNHLTRLSNAIFYCTGHRMDGHNVYTPYGDPEEPEEAIFTVGDKLQINNVVDFGLTLSPEHEKAKVVKWSDEEYKIIFN